MTVQPPRASSDASTSVLVTGATGFIGQHLCAHLANADYAVRGTYRTAPSSQGYPASVRWVRIRDIGPDTRWDEALEDIDVVVHLAALAHQPGSKGEGKLDEFMRVNALGTRSLARAAAAKPAVSRLVFVSSIGAVASFSEQKITESTVCDPDTDYGRSKRAAELAIEEELARARADWCIIRPPLVYGPGNPGNMQRLVSLVKTGLPLPLGGIQNRRSFLFVGNLVDALARCLTHPDVGEKGFLVSDGEDVSTPDLVRRIGRAINQEVRLVPLPVPALRVVGRIGDFTDRSLGIPTGLDSYSVDRLTGSLWLDSSCFRDTTGWQPPYSLDQGLKLTLGRSPRA